MNRKKTGQHGEKLALDFLKKHGYKIMETNYRSRYGEIDIVSRHKNTLIFTEVRAKTSLDYGSPEESITETKARHLRATAYNYLQTHENLSTQWQIDFIAIEIDEKNKPKRINLIESAIGEEE